MSVTPLFMVSLLISYLLSIIWYWYLISIFLSIFPSVRLTKQWFLKLPITILFSNCFLCYTKTNCCYCPTVFICVLLILWGNKVDTSFIIYNFWTFLPLHILVQSRTCMLLRRWISSFLELLTQDILRNCWVNI